VVEAHWLEISLTINGELAEVVSEALNRYVSNGVVVESGVNYTDEEDEGTPFGPVRVYGYMAVDEHLEETRQRLSEALWHLGQIQPLPEPTYREIEDEDWMAAWKTHYQPIAIGKRLLILPAWIEQKDPERLAVRIDPSMAFGTGTHPTTQLVMEHEERYVLPGQTVIDVGCGSGILSIAALKLGASLALGVDIDNAAVKSTKENAVLNDCLALIETGVGSVDEIRAGKFSLKQAPVVLANILAPVIIRLFDAGLADLVAPAGTIVLSGILDRQAADVRAAGEKHGLVFVEQTQQLDWVSIVMKKE
jgi:ribosomal protein L11 methyltransferase